MNQLEKARKSINGIDQQMAELFENRMKCVEEVIAYKMANHLPIFDESREKEVIKRNLEYIQEEKYQTYYEHFLRDVMDVSKDMQYAILNSGIYGYSGDKGAFAHIAATHLFRNGKQKSYPNFESVFHGLVHREIQAGVVPFENSYTGEVGEVLDLLFQYDVYIQKKYDLKINQNLLGLKDAKLSDIAQVYSHHQAISQSKKFLDCFDFEVIPYSNTALAAKYVAECQDISKAAIASKETADLYGLKVLVEDINTSRDNTTRFIVIGNELKMDGDYISFMFKVNHESGALAKVMEIVARYGYNMENIKSRSVKNESWQYYFYMEIQACYDERLIQMCEEIKQYTTNFKIIGTYSI